MSIVRFPATALVVGASLVAAAAFGQAPIPPANVSHGVHAIPKALTQPKVPFPANEAAEEEDLEVTQSALQASSGALRPAAISVAAGTELTPPVTITYSGSSSALTINDSGTNRGVSSLLTNPTNSNSAVLGETTGTAAGVKGINFGGNGYGGFFQITNSTNAKPALYATTYGTGSAIVATNHNPATQTPTNQRAAIIGNNTTSKFEGIGVEGVGNAIGLWGVDNSTNAGYGVYGYAPNGGTGVFGNSSSGEGVSGISTNGNAVAGSSPNGIGVIGYSAGNGTAVYGYSVGGYAGFFDGTVSASAFVTNSDRNAKTGFKPVDGGSVLELVSRLPITSWAFKDYPKQRHIGPMAQDFHAAFGLSGTDDKHINLSDAAGISLAAIQELHKRLQEKDAQISALEGQLKSMNDAFSLRLAKLEEQASANPQIVTASVPSGR